MNLRSRALAAAAAAAFAVAASPGAAAAQQTVLEVGSAAPVFEAVADDGSTWRSRDVVGRRVLVVYFYPAAMTSTCTEQACLFRDMRSELQRYGAEVVGVSGDDVEGLAAFKGANRLNFPLLSDADGAVAEAFGVPMRAGGSFTREVGGRTVTFSRARTLARWTFVIDRDGRIAYKRADVEPEGDTRAVMNVVRRLTRR